MTITNNYGLPAALVRAIQADNYEAGDRPVFLSASGFSAPPRQRVLQKKHRGEIVEDAMDRIWSLLGQATHTILERAAGPSEIVEERFYGDIAGVTISGQIDALDTSEGVLRDYKITSVWSVLDGAKEEWITQMNVQKWLCEQNGHQVEKLEIVAILRDWSKMKALQSNYPQAQVEIVPVPVWERPEEEIEGIIRLHQAAEVTLPLCTPEERWARPDSWAVMKQGAKRATKLHDNEADAVSHVNETGSSAFSVEHRPGASVRCENYCSVAAFCDQWRDIQNGEKG